MMRIASNHFFICLIHADSQFLSSTVTASAESVSGPTAGVGVTWNTTLPPECVRFVTVNFRNITNGVLVATNTTTNISETVVIQTGLQCYTNYYMRVIVVGEASYQGVPQLQLLSSSQVRVRFVGGKEISVCMGFQLQQLHGGYVIAQIYHIQLE